VADAVDRFREAARAHGLEPEIRRFPQGTRTAADAAAAIGCELGQIVKSLVFAANDAAFLALTSGANQADTARLGGLLGSAEPARRATPDEAREATGFAIGGTPPFGHPRTLRVFVDRDLLAYDEVWAAAGAPDAVFPLPPDRLVRLSGGEVEDFKA
jgi:prolyl-tRNA editing enzyme YbaK/EbsC (Cys-tRNA(Pro) deacylase)